MEVIDFWSLGLAQMDRAAHFLSLLFETHALQRGSYTFHFFIFLALLILKEASPVLLPLLSAVELQDREWSGSEGGGDKRNEMKTECVIRMENTECDGGSRGPTGF